MDTPLLDLTPGLAASAGVFGELPPSEGEPPLAEPDPSPDVNGAGSGEAERDCKPD